MCMSFNLVRRSIGEILTRRRGGRAAISFDLCLNSFFAGIVGVVNMKGAVAWTRHTLMSDRLRWLRALPI